MLLLALLVLVVLVVVAMTDGIWRAKRAQQRTETQI